MGMSQLGPETFMNVQETIINRKGENFYKACGRLVTGMTSCVFPVEFPHEQHINFAGVTTDVQQSIEGL